MTYETRPVVVCNGILHHGEPCGLVIQRNEPHLRVKVTMQRSDLDNLQEFSGMERYTAMKHNGLTKEYHFHPSCMIPANLLVEHQRVAVNVIHLETPPEDPR